MENCCKKQTIRSDKERKDLITRINRITGQLNGIKNMIEENRYCDDILIQLSAVNSSVKSLANCMLTHHLSGCVVNEIKNGNNQIIDEVINLVKRFQ